MSLYLKTGKELLRPILRGTQSSLIGNVLSIVHSMWWIEHRRLEWAKAPSTFNLCSQALLEGVLLKTGTGKVLAGALLYIAKFDDINEAYIKKRTARQMIARAWNGEFNLKKNDLITRLQWTAYHIYLYLKECFCFFMTCIDGAKSLNFNKRTQFEALSNIINNSSRAASLIFFPKEAKKLRRKLRYNIELIQTCCRCDRYAALERIETIYEYLTIIQNNSVVLSAKKNFKNTPQRIFKGASRIFNKISNPDSSFFSNLSSFLPVNFLSQPTTPDASESKLRKTKLFWEPPDDLFI